MTICKALLKYGYSEFSLEILEYCASSECLEREQYFLDTLKPKYNILKWARSFLGRKHTQETKKKFFSCFIRKQTPNVWNTALWINSG